MTIQVPCRCPVAAVCSRGAGPFREIQKQQHSILYVQGEPASRIYFMRRGTASLHRMSSEDRALGRTRALRQAGSFLGIEALVEPRYQDSARAESPLLLCVATRERIEAWIAEESEASRCVLRLVLQTENDEFVHLGAPDGTSVRRVASWILDRHQFEQTTGVSRSVIAELLGMRPETLSRALHTLDEEGLIEVQCRSFLVIDPAGLRKKLQR